MNPLHLFFHFPDGAVWGNILASVIWTTPSFIVGFVVGHHKMITHTQEHHDELMGHIHELHKKLDKVPKKRGRVWT